MHTSCGIIGQPAPRRAIGLINDVSRLPLDAHIDMTAMNVAAGLVMSVEPLAATIYSQNVGADEVIVTDP